MRTEEKARRRTAQTILAALFFTAAASQFAPSGGADTAKYAVSVERGAAAKMRDGVTLRADIYRPQADGKFPVLLVRTPYDKQWIMNFGLKAAARGYVVIAQDVRGRFTSEGDWYPFKSESQDGYDTVEWAAGLPYSNGKVGMFGGSYVGATQYLAAIAKPPHLAGICPTVTASNYHDGWTYQGGAFEQWFNESWSDIFLGGTLRNYVRLKKEAGTEAARNGQRLEVTVGGHAGGGRKIGAVDFGEKLEVDGDARMLRWYDWLLRGEANGVEKEKP